MNELTNMQGERMSALMDGELPGVEVPDVLDSVTGSAHGLAAWQSYHVVGDAIRGAAPVARLDGVAFVERFRDRLAQENAARPAPAPAELALPAVAATLRGRESANDPAWRWKLLAGAASLAAVATLGWHLAGLQAGPGAVLAKAPATPFQPSTLQAPTQSPVQPPNATPPTMLRDPRLDDLMAAHKQLGGTSALQMPAGFLRNATFNDAER